MKLLVARFRTIIVVLALVHVALLFSVVPLGPFSVDEVTYHAMTKSHSLAIENGTTTSPELEWEQARFTPSGKLVAQYPSGWPLLALPFHAAFGVRGIFLLTAFSFWGAVLATEALVRALSGKKAMAVAAALLFAFGSYAVEYGHAIWPHAPTTLAALLVVLLAIRGTRIAFLSSGLVLGAAITLRLDMAFLLPGLLVLPAWRGARSFLPPLAIVVGLLPAFAFLALTNQAKHGTWSPFSYGAWHDPTSNTSFARYVPFALAGVLGVVVAYARPRRTIVVGGGALALIVALAVPSLREELGRALRGALQILVDLRFRDLGPEPALSRTSRGALVYFGALKKAWLQSLPWLPLAILGFVRARRAVAATALPVLGLVAVYAALGWHGGFAFNLRYLVPALPFASLLAVFGVRSVLARAPRLLRRTKQVRSIALVVVLVLPLLMVTALRSPMAWREVVFLDTPLVLAGLLGVLLLFRRGKATSLALVVSMVTIGWSGVLELVYDAREATEVRSNNMRVVTPLRALHPRAGSLVAVPFTEVGSGLFDDGVALVSPARDDGRDLSRLADDANAKGGEAFIVLPNEQKVPASWAISTGKALFSVSGFTVRRIEPRRQAGQPQKPEVNTQAVPGP